MPFSRTYRTRFKPEEWEAHKSKICELFLDRDGGYTLEMVARLMKDGEGFNAR
jgi:Clr5 domain